MAPAPNAKKRVRVRVCTLWATNVQYMQSTRAFQHQQQQQQSEEWRPACAPLWRSSVLQVQQSTHAYCRPISSRPESEGRPPSRANLSICSSQAHHHIMLHPLVRWLRAHQSRHHHAESALIAGAALIYAECARTRARATVSIQSVYRHAIISAVGDRRRAHCSYQRYSSPCSLSFSLLPSLAWRLSLRL